MEDVKRPEVISFVSNKGGVGKSSHAIMTGNCLGAAGKKVGIVDLDPNNSTTTYYCVTEEEGREAKTKNIYDALRTEENDLAQFAMPTWKKGVNLIASDWNLTQLRSMEVNRLSKMIKHMSGDYDYIIIDTQPDYNNFVLNAINASTVIITPVLKDLWNVNALIFLKKMLAAETDKVNSWFITLNKYNSKYEDAKEGDQKEFVDLYRSTFDNLTPSKTWYPETPFLTKIVNYKKSLTEKKIEGAVCHAKLYNAVFNLADCFVEDALEKPEEI